MATVALASACSFAARGQASGAAPSAPSSGVAEIVVTGTQIRGVAPIGSPPIVVGRAEIVESGLNDTSDIIHDIPQISSLGSGQNYGGTANLAGLNVSRNNAINIRGLGPQATLSLIDGRRTPLQGPTAGLFDPDNIPTIALSAIEVVADGASATYGSDAVAGVANYILRKNFDGLEVEAHYGMAADYSDEKIDAILGRRWNGGSAMVAIEAIGNTQLLQGQRLDRFACDSTPFGSTNGCSIYGIPAGNIKVPTGASRPAGTYGLPVNPTGAPVAASQLGAENFYNPAFVTTLIPRDRRFSAVFNIQQQVTSKIKVWAEGYGSQNNIYYDQGVLSGSGTLKNTNPNFIPLGAGITSESFTVGLNPDTAENARHGYERSYQLAAGVDVDLPFGWVFDASYEHNYDNLVLKFPTLNTTAEAAAVACNAGGVCFNPFGMSAGNTAAVASFLGGQKFTDHFYGNVVNAKIDGTIFSLPGGDVKLAIGGEFDSDSLRGFNTSTAAGPNVTTLVVTTNTGASRTIASGFVEAVIPLVGSNNALPLVQRLDVDVAERYDRYSDVGSTTNPKVGLRWTPVNDLNVHASWGTSFRAPTLCDTNPNCSPAIASGPFTGLPAGYNTLAIQGGNTSLKPETATTYSVGGDYRPSWLRGLDLSLSYFNIDYKNVIGTPIQNNPAAVFLVSSPTSVTVNPAYARFVTLNPTQAQLNAVTALPFYAGGIPFALTAGNVFAIVNETRQNAGSIKTHGLDFSASYDWSNAYGRWSVGAFGSYLMNWDYQLLPGGPIVDRIDQATYPVSLRARAKFAWSNDHLSAIAYVNYDGSYRVVSLAFATQNQPVKAYTTVDTTLIYRLGKPGFGRGLADNISLSLAVQNLFNTAPPFALVTNAVQFDQEQASDLGRLITFGVRKTF